MKFIFALLVLTPLVYCATPTHEEQLVIQAMTEQEKRALLIAQPPDVSIICQEMRSGHMTCTQACQKILATVDPSYHGSYFHTLCSSACTGIHC